MRIAVAAAVSTLLCGCAGIDSEMLKSFDTAAQSAQTFTAESNAAAARSYRLAAIEQASVTGVLWPDYNPASVAGPQIANAGPAPHASEARARPQTTRAQHPDLDQWRTQMTGFAQDTLCRGETEFFLGASEIRAASALGRDVHSFDVTPPDTVLGNLALLASPPPLPSAAATPNAQPDPNAPPPPPDVHVATTNDQSAQAKKPYDLCVEDFNSAKAGFLTTGQPESAGGTLLSLITELDRSLRPQAVAVLQALVRAEQRRRLVAYLHEHDSELEALAQGLRTLEPKLQMRLERTRRLRAYDYLIAFETMRASLLQPSHASHDPLRVAVAGARNLEDAPDVKAVLDAGDAYDAALAAPAPAAIEDLAVAVDHLRAYERGGDAAAAAASLRATIDFANALKALADATHDPALKARVEAFTHAL